MDVKKVIKIYIKRMLITMIMVSIIFTSFNFKHENIIYATESEVQNETEEITEETTENTQQTVKKKMEADIADWLEKTHENHIYYYEYKEDGKNQEVYAAKMPMPNGDTIIYNGVNGNYIYNVKDSDGNITDQIQFNVELLVSVIDPIPELNNNNYKQYNNLSGGLTLEDKDGTLLKRVDLDSKEVPVYMAYAVKLEDCDLISTESVFAGDILNGRSWGEQFLNWFSNGLLAIWDFVSKPIANIINDLLLGIADRVKELVEGIFGEDVSLYKVIFGKIDKLSINYWEKNATSTDDDKTENPEGIVDNAPAATLKNIVSYWYGVLHRIVIAVYLVMLLYIGIRILLSSTGKAGQKYKDMLSSWIVGIVILTFYPYVMRYTVVLNDLLIGMIDPITSQVTEDGEEIQEEDYALFDTMEIIRKEAEDNKNIAFTIIYLIMLGQLIVLIAVYYKRVFMMAFLITIFPVVAGIYIWEKTKGGGKSLTTWTKEYVILVFAQAFHAVVYVVLIDGAYLAFKQSNNWFVFMISVLFLFEAEKIIRSIFGMKSSANTIGDLATAGAAALAVSGKFKDIIKGDKKSKSEDDKNAEEADETIKEAKRNTTVNRLISGNQGPRDELSYGLDSSNGGSAVGANGATGVTGGGNPQAGTNGNPNADIDNNEADFNDFNAAQAAVTADGFKKRTKRNIVAKAINVTGRVAGITLGATSGLAMGSGKDALANAAIGNEIGGLVARAPMMITGWAKGVYDGKVMKKKILKGEMDDKLRQVGFDLSRSFDQDAAISEAKARIYRKALAAKAEITRRKGKAAGDAAYIDVVETERRKEGF